MKDVALTHSLALREILLCRITFNRLVLDEVLEDAGGCSV